MRLTEVVSLFLLIFLISSISLESSIHYDYELIVGQTTSIKVYSPRRVSIDAPAICDIVKATKDEVVLMAKASGTAHLKIEDLMGEKLYTIRVFSEDLNTLQAKIQELLKDAGLKVTTKTSKERERIILEGTVSPQDRKKLGEILGPYKNNILNFTKEYSGKDLVYIDVEVLEIAKSALDQLGIDWVQEMRFTEGWISTTTEGAGEEATTRYWLPMRSFAWGRWLRSPLSATLNFLAQEGKLKTLARPKLVVVSGKEAQVNVGGEIPILTVSGGEPEVTYKSYGVILNISPTVLDNNSIDTRIKVEVSEPDWQNAITATSGISGETVTTYKLPGFKKRTATTQLYLKSGETLFIAGLIKDTESKNISKIPGAGEIPILGALFRSKRFERGQTELVISITPRIIKSSPAKEEGVMGEAKLISEFKPRKKAEGLIPLPLAQYLAFIKSSISHSIRLPQELQVPGYQGKLVLSLHIDEEGNLLDARVSHSSGLVTLDNLALEAAKKITYPKFPEEILEKELWVEIPVEYRS